jgi:DNA-3-methyladenine glycosylase I
LASFVWRFAPPASERPHLVTAAALRGVSATDASTRLSRVLKRRGFRFVGPTTAYAFMQAMGLVNDHIEGCAARYALADQPASAPSP